MVTELTHEMGRRITSQRKHIGNQLLDPTPFSVALQGGNAVAFWNTLLPSEMPLHLLHGSLTSIFHQYSALYAITRPSVCLSVCLSFTRVDQSKTVHIRIMQPSPQSSLMTLQCESKNTPLRFSDIFPQTVGNFLNNFYTPFIRFGKKFFSGHNATFPGCKCATFEVCTFSYFGAISI